MTSATWRELSKRREVALRSAVLAQKQPRSQADLVPAESFVDRIDPRRGLLQLFQQQVDFLYRTESYT